MDIRNITEKDKTEFNQAVSHPLQSYEWGEFRAKTGIKVIRRGFFDKGKLVKAFTLTIHKIPRTPWTIGYLPKGDLPDHDLINELQNIGKAENCLFIHVSQITSDFIENPHSLLKPGQKIIAKIVKIDEEEGRLGLSVKEYNKDVRKQTVAKYAKAVEQKVTLGDVMGEQLANG